MDTTQATQDDRAPLKLVQPLAAPNSGAVKSIRTPVEPVAARKKPVAEPTTVENVESPEDVDVEDVDPDVGEVDPDTVSISNADQAMSFLENNDARGSVDMTLREQSESQNVDVEAVLQDLDYSRSLSGSSIRAEIGKPIQGKILGVLPPSHDRLGGWASAVVGKAKPLKISKKAKKPAAKPVAKKATAAKPAAAKPAAPKKPQCRCGPAGRRCLLYEYCVAAGDFAEANKHYNDLVKGKWVWCEAPAVPVKFILMPRGEGTGPGARTLAKAPGSA